MNTFILSVLSSLFAAAIWECVKYLYIKKIKDHSNGVTF